MAVRQIYSCDWCCVDSKNVGSIDDDWRIVPSPTLTATEKLYLCGMCHKAGCEAWDRARMKRQATNLANDESPNEQVGYDG